MKTLTLFLAYRECRDRMSWQEQIREKGSFDILVDKDLYAIRYQRIDRLAMKLDLGWLPLHSRQLAQQPVAAKAEAQAGQWR